MTIVEALNEITKTLPRQYKELSSVYYKELSNMNNSCYVPNIRYKLEEIFKSVIKDNNKEIRKALKSLFSKYSNFSLLNNEYTNYLLMIVLLTIKDRQFKYAEMFHNILVLKFYASLLYKYIRYCNKDRFDEGFNLLHPTHLFKKHKTIPNAIVKLSEAIFKRHKDTLKFDDPKGIIKYVYEVRHRINQSLKSFAKAYYKARVLQTPIEGVGDEYIDNVEITISTILNKTLTNYIVYKHINNDIIKFINTGINVNKSAFLDILKELQNTKYNDELEYIFRLILNKNTIEIIRTLNKWFLYVKKTLLSQKSTSDKNIRIVASKLLVKLKSYKKHFSNKNIVTKRRVVNVFVLYFALYIRSNIVN